MSANLPGRMRFMLTSIPHSARTGKQVRQAVTDFALVCRGLDGSAYGAATTMY